ncbi:MAG: FkbM family methyltransferase [Flavobacteriales bacterium]
MKQLLKKILSALGIYVSKNQKYDALLEKILEQKLSPDSNCVDVGSHVGEILDLFLKYAPNGKHIGFEPIPHLAKSLKEKYMPKVIIKSYGLSNSTGEKTFTHVKNAEAFSGFRERDYQNRNVDLDTITVQTTTLDHILKEEDLTQTTLIKIDVEGAELEVLEGAIETINRDKPLVIFEHGKGAADFYKTSPEQVFGFFFERCNMKVNTLNGFLSNSNALSKDDFSNCFNSGSEYYFIAYA